MGVHIRAFSNNRELVEQRRNLIMESAIKVFARKSYAEATIQEIAEVARMSTGNIYRYIGAKEDILHLMCVESKERIADLHDFLKNTDHKSVVDELKQCIRFYVEGNVERADRHLFYNREIRSFSHEDRALLLQSQVDHVEFFEKLIRKGIEREEFATKYPLLLAHNILLLPHDWLLRRWFLSKYFSLGDFIDRQIEVILNSLLKPDYVMKEETGRRTRNKGNLLRTAK